ncbi:MAG: EamA family transporter [Deltaproteobacteria bacterium]|nr:EamA family transporter [Deltaproteobacteria bacterium]
MIFKTQALISIHLSVLLFGVAGLFGKLIHLSPSMIVFGRTLFASIALAIVLPMLKTEFRIKSKSDLLGFFCMGAILAVHWMAFFHSIQISTVAIGLLTYSSFPIFVTFLEPFFLGEKVRVFDILISVVVFWGLVLVIPEFDLSNNLTRGVFWGVFSGFTFAVLSILNRRYVADYSALAIALYQDVVACLILLPFVGHSVLSLTSSQWSYLVLLGVVFTALAHTLFIRGMLVVKAQLASVIACLEPVYGILIALAVLHEIPSSREIFGGVVIVGAIVYATQKSGAHAGSQTP